jgi:hypothetical protein
MPKERRVSNAPFREAFLASPMEANELARHMGWGRKKRNRSGSISQVGDGSEVLKKLGIRATTSGDGHKTYTKTISESNALKMLEFFPGLDPVDVDL